MKKKYVCEYCDEEFSSKKKFISHLEEELEYCREEAMNAEEDVIELEEKIQELK